MSRHAVGKQYGERRLGILLSLLFTALAVPTGALILQAYDQLKWEAWYQYRSQAEELANRLDAGLQQQIARAESRSFDDFSFMQAAPGGGLQQRSPLSAFPVSQDLPGVIGYFQIDPEGAFTTPILPGSELRLSIDDFEARSRAAGDIRRILARNRLVRERQAFSRRSMSDGQANEAAPPVAPATGDARGEADGGLTDRIEETVDDTDESASFEQQAFDQLRQAQRPSAGTTGRLAGAEEAEPGAPVPQATGRYGKLADLNLDDKLAKRNDEQSRQPPSEKAETMDAATSGDAHERKQPAAPETASHSFSARQDNAITTFASEVDPYQFSRLDSGHFVLHRNVWKEGSRFIQGLLLDQGEFRRAVIERPFSATLLSDMSDLVVGYRGDIIGIVRGGSDAYAGSRSGEFDGALLYRSRLAAPFDAIELIFSVTRLPPGPGATVLAWTTVVIAFVFAGGFFALYRLGGAELRLARQQQDFVSAVSHELKTPLTSIRMYAEMLKEGWLDEAKRKLYYDYIHDESERLARLISNVLRLASITRNKPQFDLHPVAAGQLMSDIESRIASQAERAGFVLEIDRDGKADEARINIDSDCFLQVVINLIDNAIKFSQQAEQKCITISNRLTADGHVVFGFRDFGPGIPNGQLKKIFRLFYRTESELTRDTAGTGIGLAIVHELVRGMHGSIDVVNCAPGAKFLLSFPQA